MGRMYYKPLDGSDPIPVAGRGPTGPTGPASTVPGPQGPTGPTGQAGEGITIKGTVPTWADLPSSGNQTNDAWMIANEPGTLGVWTEQLVWERFVAAEGPAGPRGAAGAVVSPTQPTDPEVVIWIDESI